MTLATRPVQSLARPSQPDQIYFSFQDLEAMSIRVAKSGLFPSCRTPEAAFALMLLCQADGLHPMKAIRMFDIIEGRPAMKSEVMLANFQKVGGHVHWELTQPDRCRARFFHPKFTPKEGTAVEITLNDLVERGIATKADGKLKDNYRKSPESMLQARVASRGVRMICPACLHGMYAPEEIVDMTEEELEGIPVVDMEMSREMTAPAMMKSLVEEAKELKANGEDKTFAAWAKKFVATANEKFAATGAANGWNDAPEVGYSELVDVVHRETFKKKLHNTAEPTGVEAQDVGLISNLWKANRQAIVDIGKHMMSYIKSEWEELHADNDDIDTTEAGSRG